MNDLEYLNQISAKPAQAQSSSFFDKKTKIIFIIFGVVLLLAIVLMISLSSSQSSSEPTETSELSRLYRRSESLEKSISAYQSSIKASSLRSSVTSLSALITGLKTTSSNYLTKTLGVELSAYPITASDAAAITSLNSALENARLNGILDRVAASEFYYQIAHLIVIEESVLKKTSNSELKDFLSSSVESLSLLDETFYSYSEST